jgi:hypothetical protein
MLSWSSHEQGELVDVAHLVADVRDGIDGGGGVALGSELSAFASAAAGSDLDALARRREALVAATSWEFMVDAAAVVANFEMMTRVADGTGARFPTAVNGVGDSDRWVSARAY